MQNVSSSGLAMRPQSFRDGCNQVENLVAGLDWPQEGVKAPENR
jgi:hypothetical protein